MFKKNAVLIFILLSMTLAACGETPMPAATAAKAAALPASTSTADSCSSANLPNEIKKVHDLTREFDDYATLTSSLPQAQVAQFIPNMQEILRRAEDQQIPACLKKLKEFQLSHMTVVVQTLLAFLSVKDAAGAEQVNAGIAQARQLRQQYDVERARLLGITLAAQPTVVSLLAASNTAAPANIAVKNNGTSSINLRNAPDVNAALVGILGAQVTTTALGKTADSQWLQVEIPDKPGQRAWVYAQLVALSAPIEQLPVVAP
jgi:hypothetical protein